MWVEQLDETAEWLTQGRTVLLPKTEELSNEKNYHSITCLNTHTTQLDDQSVPVDGSPTESCECHQQTYGRMKTQIRNKPGWTGNN